MSSEEAKALLLGSEIVEPGKGIRGFHQSERRTCIGGRVWRRWKPWSASREWSYDYESWEYDGPTAQAGVRACSELSCTCSRLDVAWDILCEPELGAYHLVDSIRPWVEGEGLTIGASGEGAPESWTWYIGARKASRRVRVYRKDLESPEEFARGENLEGLNLLRVEITVKDDYADALWRDITEEAPEDGIKAAAGFVHDMTGLTLGPRKAAPLAPKQDASLVSSCVALAWQFGGLLLFLKAKGVNLDDILQARDAQRDKRQVKADWKRRDEAFPGARELERRVIAQLESE